MALTSTHKVYVRDSAGTVTVLNALTEVDARTQAATQRALGKTVTMVRQDTTIADVVVAPTPAPTGKK